MSSASIVSIDLHTISTSALFGGFLSWGLFGVLLTQFYTYYNTSYHKDPVLVRLTVSVVLITELAVEGCKCYIIYVIVLDTPSITQFHWAAALPTPGTGFITLLVQLFFAWRIWKYGQASFLARIMAGVIVTISLLQMSGSLVYAIVWIKKYHTNLDAVLVSPVLHWAITIWFSGSFVSDFLITASMVTLLVRSKQQHTTIASTIQTINRLIVQSVETGVMTTVVALIEFVLYAHSNVKFKGYFVVPNLLLSEVYAIMLMANLNNRGSLSATGRRSEVIEFHSMSTANFAPGPHVFIATTTEHDIDGGTSGVGDSYKKT